MAGSKIDGFLDLPQVVWGIGEEPVTERDLSDCDLAPLPDLEKNPEKAGEYFAQTKALVQRVLAGQCVQSKHAEHPLHINAAFAELWLKEKVWDFLSTFGEESHVLAANLILRELNPLDEQPLDGFIPARYLVVKSASQYLDQYAEAVKKITQTAISKVRHRIGRFAHQVVWLDFSEGLETFFARQPELQRELKERVSDLLKEVFQGYNVSFFLSEVETKKSFSPSEKPKYITVRFTFKEPEKSGEEQKEVTLREMLEDPRWQREDFVEALRQEFGEEAVGETRGFFWSQAIKKPEIQKLLFLLHYYGATNSPDLVSMKPAKAYFGNEHLEEEIQVFLGSFVLTQWHKERVVVGPKMKGKTAEANRERLAQLLVYTVFHEMMHTFGIPHLPEHKAGPLFMMYGSESIDLSPVWKSDMGSVIEIIELRTLRGLLKLARYDQEYVDYQLKLPEPNKTGQRIIKEEEDKSMGCDFTKIKGRCYGMHPIGGLEVEEAILDLLQYEDGSKAKGVGVLDEEDLYLAPEAKEPTRLPIDKVLRIDDEKWWKLGLPGSILYMGHLFGQGLDKLRSDYYEGFFAFDRDLLISPYFPADVEAALVTYSMDKVDTYFQAEVLAPQTSPITDQHPSMPVVLCRLRQMATGEKKPMANQLAKDGQIFTDPDEERINKKEARALIQYYWRMGSDTAGRILDELKVPRKERFDWVNKKLNEKSGGGLVAQERTTAPSCEPFANVTPPKVSVETAAGENCKAGFVFLENPLLNSYERAKKCADLLTQTTGRPHDVKPQTENISDGLPAVVSQIHYRIVEK